ncbi:MULTISPECIES: SGNH/GDSL hydrolase family protein [unclassified Blastococcus]
MARGDHWWTEPPWWAWSVMIGSLVAIIVMLPFALNRSAPESDATDNAAATRESSPSSAGPTASATPTGSAEPTGAGDATQVLVIGDADTAGAAGGEGWPAALEELLPDVEMTVAATGEAGYVTTDGDPTLPQLVGDADLEDADVVVLFGSRFDASGIADQVDEAARFTLAALAERAPDAELVVIGPVWPDDAPPAGVRNNRDVLRLAATEAGVTFVDPIADGWLTDAPDLVGPDGESLTAAADAYLADRIEPVLQAALDG